MKKYFVFRPKEKELFAICIDSDIAEWILDMSKKLSHVRSNVIPSTRLEISPFYWHNVFPVEILRHSPKSQPPFMSSEMVYQRLYEDVKENQAILVIQKYFRLVKGKPFAMKCSLQIHDNSFSLDLSLRFGEGSGCFQIDFNEIKDLIDPEIVATSKEQICLIPT